MQPFVEALDGAGARVRRRDGHDALREGRLRQQVVRRAEPRASPTSSPACTTSTCAPAPTCSRPTPSAPTASSSQRSAWPSKLHDINVAGARIARQAARDQAYVAGRDRPARHPHRAVGQDRRRRGRSATSASRREALLAGGVDLFVLETFRDLNEIGAAIAAVRAVSDLPIVAQMTTEEDGNTPRRHAAGEVRAGARRRAARRSSA